jgi:hypothetical protein
MCVRRIDQWVLKYSRGSPESMWNWEFPINLLTKNEVKKGNKDRMDPSWGLKSPFLCWLCLLASEES